MLNRVLCCRIVHLNVTNRKSAHNRVEFDKVCFMLTKRMEEHDLYIRISNHILAFSSNSSVCHKEIALETIFSNHKTKVRQRFFYVSCIKVGAFFLELFFDNEKTNCLSMFHVIMRQCAIFKRVIVVELNSSLNFDVISVLHLSVNLILRSLTNIFYMDVRNKK